MRHRSIMYGDIDACFAPPRVAARPERRLTARAAARLAGGGGHEFRDNAVTLAGEDFAVAVGRAVTAGFGLVEGLLGGAPDTLAGVLARVAAAGHDAPALFEAAVASLAADCVLLRGLWLPTAGGGEAVLSWKHVLGDDAAARLRAELLREARPRRLGIDPFPVASRAR